MQFILRILFLFTVGFMYADCEDFTNEADCTASQDCEWHADDMACEEAGHDDDHDHEHCDELSETECEASDHCEWHADEGVCEEAGHDDDHDDHDEGNNVIEIVGLAEGATTFTLSVMHDGHADYTSMPIYVTVEGGDHGDDDHDDHEHCDELSETECEASDHCEWHADDMACEEAGHDDHDHGDCGDFDHLDIDGLTLEHDGEVIYSQFQGYITGSLELHIDDRIDVTVHFLDQNGDEIAYTEDNPASCFP